MDQIWPFWIQCWITPAFLRKHQNGSRNISKFLHIFGWNTGSLDSCLFLYMLRAKSVECTELTLIGQWPHCTSVLTKMCLHIGKAFFTRLICYLDFGRIDFTKTFFTIVLIFWDKSPLQQTVVKLIKISNSLPIVRLFIIIILL